MVHIKILKTIFLKFRVLSKEHRSQLRGLSVAQNGTTEAKKKKGIWGYDPMYKINIPINGRREKHLTLNYSR